MRLRHLLFSISALLLLFIGSCNRSSDKQAAQAAPATTPAAATSDKSTTPALQFTAYDTDGKLHNSSEWLGKGPVIINLWGTWCPPCRREIPDLVKLYKEYHPKGLEIVGLAIKDSPDAVHTYAQKAGMDWVLLMGNIDIAVKLKAIDAVPTTIFFDKNGNEVDRVIGAQSYNEFKPLFDKIL